MTTNSQQGGGGPQATQIGSWFRRKRLLLGLLRDKNHRRDLMSLWMIQITGMPWIKLLGAAAMLAALGAWLFSQAPESPAQGYEILQVLTALAALAAGANIYSRERENGTLELVWLATGSEKSYLRFRLTTLMTVLLFFVVPAALFAKGQYESLPPAGLLIASLAINVFFLLVLMAYIATYFPQAWAAGLFGIFLVASVYTVFRGSEAMIYPFLSPIGGRRPGEMPDNFIPNRVMLFLVSLVLLRMTATRLRRAF